MPQINLLKQKSAGENALQVLPGIIVKLLAVVVLLLGGYYGWQFFKIKSVNKKIIEEQQGISAAQQSVATITNRDELYTRQAQLQQLDGLISKHLYWSKLFPALAKVTLKQASFSSINLTKEGGLIMAVAVPDLVSLDKFLQVFDYPEFNSNFNNLRIGAFRKDATADGKEIYTFDARLDFNPAILKYQDNSAQDK